MLSCLTTAMGIVVRKDMYLDYALAAIVVSPIMLSNMSAYAKQGLTSSDTFLLLLETSWHIDTISMDLILLLLVL
jgi:hypothetical protein